MPDVRHFTTGLEIRIHEGKTIYISFNGTFMHLNVHQGQAEDFLLSGFIYTWLYFVRKDTKANGLEKYTILKGHCQVYEGLVVLGLHVFPALLQCWYGINKVTIWGLG